MFLQLIKSDNRNKRIQEIYSKKFGEQKFKEINKKSKKESIIAILSSQIKDSIVIEDSDLIGLARQRANNIKMYFLSHKLRLDRIQIKNDVFENKDNDTKELSLKLELNIKD